MSNSLQHDPVTCFECQRDVARETARKATAAAHNLALAVRDYVPLRPAPGTFDFDCALMSGKETERLAAHFGRTPEEIAGCLLDTYGDASSLTPRDGRGIGWRGGCTR